MSDSNDYWLAYFRETQRYSYATLALYTLTAIASSGMCIASLCGLRRYGDPARRFLRWQKAVFIIFTITIYVRILTDATGVAANQFRIDGGGSGGSASRLLNHITTYVGTVWRTLLEISAILMLLTLISFGMGLRGAQNGSQVTSAGKAKYVKYAGYAIAAVLVCLNLAICALELKAYVLLLVFYDRSERYNAIMTDSSRILFAYALLMMLLALGVVVWAALMRFRKNTASTMGKTKAATYFLVCSLLFLLEATYLLGSLAAVIDLKSFQNSKPFEPYQYVTDLVFHTWPLFVILVLLYVIGKRQDEGLWTGGVPYQPSLQYMGQMQGQMQGQQQMYQYQYGQPAMGNSPQPTYPVSPMSPQQMGPNLSPQPPQQLGPNVPPPVPASHEMPTHYWNGAEHKPT